MQENKFSKKMIEKNIIEHVINTAEIVDVVQDFVSLKKRGANYLGLCPFHNEKTPSFTVSPTKGIFKCFGCGKVGNTVAFIMEIEKLSFPDAIRHLAKKYNIEIVESEREITEEERQLQNERESMFIVSAFAQRYFSKILFENETGQTIGLSYLHERGISNEMISHFQLGFCLHSKDNFTQAALKEGYKLEFLEKTGLTINREGNIFDRFYGRIIFPIHSISGKIIGFGGRIIKKTDKTAKYLNSPESEIYHKSDILYGLFFAKNFITRFDKCFLVEGYTDVISLVQAGIENVVASAGTSLTVNQIRLIKRFTKNLTIIYDGDAAGIKASLRGIDLVLEEGMNVKVLLLPDGEDPDSFSKKLSNSELRLFIERNETDFIVFKTKLLAAEAQNDPIKRANLYGDILRSIALIPDSLIRAEYIKECSNLLKVEEKNLYFEVGKRRAEKIENEYWQEKRNISQQESHFQTTETFEPHIKCEHLEREMIRILLIYGNQILHLPNLLNENPNISVQEFIINELEKDALEFENFLYKNVLQEFENFLYQNVLQEIKQHSDLNDKYFINHSNHEVSKLAIDLMTSQYFLSKIWSHPKDAVQIKEIDLNESIPTLILRYKDKKIILLIKEIEEKLKNEFDEEVQKELMKTHIILKEVNKEFAKLLGERVIIY